MEEEIIYRRCNICGKEKPLSEFYKDRTYPLGHACELPSDRFADHRVFLLYEVIKSGLSYFQNISLLIQNTGLNRQS
jgi:hypothetical protein